MGNSKKEHNVCFSCLKDGHSIARCTWKKVCGVQDCKKKHSKFLHIEKAVPNLNANNQSIVPNHNLNRHEMIQTSKLYFKIIPVKIHGKDRILDTFGFIDECSLIDLDLLNDLNLAFKDF